MEKDEALAIVNSLWRQAAMLGRATATAMKDGKIQPFEALQLTMQASMLGTFLISTFQSITPETRDAITYILEHGRVEI